ncbi:MAG TPA: hypothetical protein VFJ84_01805 [Candidatus Saccharimonadales bacterium]|nr:hypothetical protein [Candidatus Saccharimonadales bacterium]
MAKGLFIVIEGAPGSGAASQLNLLAERLKAVGHDVELVDLPRLSHDSGHFIRRYLEGGYGDSEQVSPYAAALFYALDRYEAAERIKRSIESGRIVLASNYVGASMAEQGSKFSDPTEQRGFFVWIDSLEYQLMGVPRPDISLYLRLPADVSAQHASNNKLKLTEYKKRLATYDLLCRLFPKDYRALESSQNGKKLDFTAINNLIWDAVKPLLPVEKPRPSRSVVVSVGKEQDAFPVAGSDEKALRLPIKEGSVLLKMFMEQIRPGSTSPALGSWSSGDYKLYKFNAARMPKTAGAFRELLASYQQLERQIRQKAADKKQADELLMHLTPLAALTSFTLTIDIEDVREMTSRLLTREQPEAQWAAKQIYMAARQKWPQVFKRPLESADEPSAMSQSVMAKLASEWLSADGGLEDRVKLLDASPRREFDLLAESIYPYSNLSLAEISEEVTEWPYSQKSESLKKWAAQPGLLKKAHYKLDIISDLITQIRISQAAGLQNTAVQPPTPRFGFDIPIKIEEMGLDDSYSEVFDASLAAYSSLQAEAGEETAVYGVLLGHKARWQLQADAEQMLKIHKLKSSGMYQPVVSEIEEKLADAHPLLWDILTGKTAAQPRRAGKSRVKPARRRSGKSKK